MSDIGYNRCPNDDWKAGTAQIGENPKTGQPVELNINGISAVVSVQSALLTLSAAMKAGHEKDFIEKIALCLFGKLQDDPHAICPLLTVLSMVLLMLRGVVDVTFDNEGHVVITPPDVPIEPGPACMYDLLEGENENGTDEGTVDGIGPGPKPGDGTDEGGGGTGPT
jgi:hypothetical protein